MQASTGLHGSLVQQTVALVSAFGKQHKSLGRAWRQLSWDLLAALAGLKSAVMLDYCYNLQVATLQQLLQQLCHVFSGGAWLPLSPSLHASAKRSLTVTHCSTERLPLCAATKEGCCYILHIDRLQGQLQQAAALLTFEGSATATGTVCRTASLAEQQVRAADALQLAIREVAEPIVQAMTEQMRPVHAILASLQPCCVLDMDVLPTPLLPTFNGLLLGYPVVYAVTAATVDAAAACLSCQALRLVQLNASCPEAEVGPCSRNRSDCCS